MSPGSPLTGSAAMATSGHSAKRPCGSGRVSRPRGGVAAAEEGGKAACDGGDDEDRPHLETDVHDRAAGGVLDRGGAAALARAARARPSRRGMQPGRAPPMLARGGRPVGPNPFGPVERAVRTVANGRQGRDPVTGRIRTVVEGAARRRRGRRRPAQYHVGGQRGPLPSAWADPVDSLRRNESGMRLVLSSGVVRRCRLDDRVRFRLRTFGHGLPSEDETPRPRRS
jgi:hypothetical protein